MSYSHKCLIDLCVARPDRVRCVMSLRGNGDGAYGGFNACHYVGDTPEHVAASRRLLSKELNVGIDRIVIPRQTHSLNVAVISDENDLHRSYDDVDALVTILPEVAICVNTADCVPVVMADTVHGVVGVAHSGWRGTVGRIASRTLEAMLSAGAMVEDIDVIVGACICPDCFEVGDEVAVRFDEEFRDETGVIVRRGYSKPHIDLPAAIVRTLMDAGVDHARISLSGVCSRCGDLPLFSARRDGIASGRTLTAVMLRG